MKPHTELDDRNPKMNDERADLMAGSTCPAPLSYMDHIVMAHGGGGRLMHELLEQVFRPAFDNPLLADRHDGARFDVDGKRLAFTTDSYVVRPLFFPGGDIGSLAVYGTVNDLAMCGARPLYLSVAFILEEGYPIERIRAVAQSMRAAAAEAAVMLVTGDTKVVDRGRGDGLYVTTAGIGVIEHERWIGPRHVHPGDAILVSGDIGRHGIAILAAREELALETANESDSAPLAGPVLRLLAAGLELHCLRDCTRGGLAAALIEISETGGWLLEVHEDRVPVAPPVQGACELLGLDPLSIANEGRFVCFLPESQVEQALGILRGDTLTSGAQRIGRVGDALTAGSGQVLLHSRYGVARVLDLPSGELLPRIC
jgi:hydrogenase expression/formation protein HypE